MSFNELIKILKVNGFALDAEKGSVRIYRKAGWPKAIRVDYHGSHEIAKGTAEAILKSAGIKDWRK